MLKSIIFFNLGKPNYNLGKPKLIEFYAICLINYLNRKIMFQKIAHRSQFLKIKNIMNNSARESY